MNIIIFFLLLNNLFSSEVEIVINKKINKKINYIAKVVSSQSSNEQETNNVTEYKFSYKFLENNEDGIIYSWKIEEILNYKELSGFSRALQRLNEGLEINFYINADGEYKAVDNWAEILEFYEKKLLKLKEEFWGDEKAISYINSLKSNLLTPEKLSEFLLSELIMFHNFYGAKLTLNKNEINNVSIIDEYMGINLPIINESKLTKNEKTYTLVVSEKIDQLRADAILKNEARKFDTKPIPYSNSQNFKFEYNHLFEVVKLNFEKNVKIGSDYLNKTVEIKRVN
jgi:hypothetical protein